MAKATAWATPIAAEDEPAQDRAEPIARAEEQLALRRGVDVQHRDRDPEPEAVPRQPAPDPWPLPVARRLVVLGRAEPLGVQPEHRQQQRQPDHDERRARVEQVLHAP